MVLKWMTMAFLLATSFAQGQTIDKNCMTCDRRSLDSLNTIIGPVRVNQVGYRTDDPHKRALVGSPSAATFQVLRPNGTVAFSGTLKDLGEFPYKGRILITGYFNSITPLYKFRNTNDTDSAGGGKERVSSADFGALTETGTFRVAVGKDTSHFFDIRSNIYNDIFETSIKYFGIARSGDDSSQMHARSHMKDGSGRPGGDKVAGSLRGGWYDCGDFFKVGQTDAYAFTNLMLAYTLWPQKAEDRYGNSYNDTIPFGNDGIPDLLREAKVGADYVMRLYRASHEDGLLAKNDMYQEVGVWINDHMLWDMPERQDAAPVAKGGAPRPVDAGAGSAVAGQYAGSLALFAKAWYPFDPVFADSCLAAAKDIYTRIVIPNWKTPGYAPTMFYITQGRWDDDLAWAAAGLWYATGDTTYKFDLMGNTTYGTNPGYIYNRETFRAGFMAIHSSKLFSPGGWVMDYQNTFLHPVWLMWKHIYQTDAMAAKWGIGAAEAQDTRMRLKTLVGYRYARECTNSPDGGRQTGTYINIMRPYNLVWSSVTWGMNRYNMGGLLPIVAYHEMIKDDSAASARNYWDIILDNMNYNLGANPWDISFLMGAGSKNLQHPHNRISNPEGYNAGGIPYKYRSPKGALMGGAIPGQLLRDEWEKYDVTETCIDFSSQMILPSQYLAEDLPPDTTGPGFLDVVAMPADTFAIVSWKTTELSRDTLFYSLSVNGPVIGYMVAPLAKNKMVVIPGLTPKTQYFFWFVGMDIYRNVSRDDNRGRDYDFTTLSTSPPIPKITDVKACNIRGNQATIFWWTDVPSLSSVEYAIEGANFAATKKRVDGDDEGLPSRFHKVTLKGLQPGTTYRYDVFSTPAKSDSLGLHYRFSTTQDFASYTVQMAATSKNASGAGAHFYLQVANNENKPYYGLDLRFYFTADAATAAKIAVHVTDKAIFGVTGTVIPKSPDITVAAAVAVPGVANSWYLPIHIADTLPVAGRLRFDLKMDDNNWAPVPFSVFANAWSVAPRAAPVAFPGIDLKHLWPGPDDVQMWNGVPTPIYVDNPYIGGYYNGVHIFGYTPDGDLPKQPKIVDFRFEKPLPSPATSVRQDSLMVHFQGRTWGKPDVALMQVQRDSAAFVPTTLISNRVDSVRFAQTFPDPQGLNIHEWAFWADRETPLCGCAWQRYLVNVDTMKVPPRPLHLAWNPAGPVEAWTSSRALATVALLGATNDTLDTTALVTLSSANPGLQFWTTATGGAPASSVVLVGGKAQVWVSSPVVDSGRVNASAAIAGSSVTSGSVWVRFTDKPPRRLALVWTPAGPIDAWSGGQRKSASVTLVDSAGTLLDTSAVVHLASSAPSVQFWSGVSGALPATSIALVHGVGTVWFSDALADTAALTASATVAGAVVTDAALVVRFVATPPWPLVDSAWTTDASCDGIADSVAVRLSMALDAGAVVQSATLTLSGKPLSIPAASIVASGRNVLLPVPAGLDGSAMGSGVLALHVTTGGRDQIVLDSFFVQDRVQPQVLSAAVMERFGAGTDTVRVEFSEPVAQPSGWPFSVAGATAPTSVVSVQKLSGTLVQWVLAGSAFPAGSMMGVASAGLVRDLAGNALATCAAAVPLVVRAKPDPMISAAITDPSGIGSATSISVRFARAVRDQDMPDSFVVLWDNLPRTVPLANVQRLPTDSSVLVGTLVLPSPAGTGIRSGGVGMVQFLKGSGASGRLDSIVAQDSVGPALRSAILRVGTLGDTLVLRLSEPATEGAGAVRDLLLKSGVVLPAATSRHPNADPLRWTLAIPSGSVIAGDSLRLAGAAFGAWVDRSSNPAAPNAPWVPVKVGDRTPTTAKAIDSDGDGNVDQVVLTWASRPSQLHDFSLAWPDASGRILSHPVDSSAGVWSGGTLTLSVAWPGPSTVGPGTGLQVNRYDDGTVDSLPFALADGVGPVAMSARLRYAAFGEKLDTLWVNFSETVLPTGVNFVRLRRANGTWDPVAGVTVQQTPDGKVLMVLLDPVSTLSTRMMRGDSLQVWPGATDALGNPALETGRRVKVEFGTRPPRFSMDFLPGRLAQPTAVPVSDGNPPVRILVREPGAEIWHDLDGLPVDPNRVRIGPKILANFGYGGQVLIYDNLGVHVANVSLDPIVKAFEDGRIPSDPAGQWEAWIAWDGLSQTGKPVVSGVYTVRTLIRKHEGDTFGKWINKVDRVGWIRK
ncbi:MAG: glycoside hydrolase family 9 protein [Fibrobacterota bacterium]|nr:MAG: glycoside hydrolase family 9 protein [Fibrobacterota bacterium]